jgi:hypothetical protein
MMLIAAAYWLGMGTHGRQTYSRHHRTATAQHLVSYISHLHIADLPQHNGMVVYARHKENRP